MMTDQAYNELNKKYEELLEENRQLREKNRVLETASEQRVVSHDSSDNSFSSYVPANALSAETQIESNIAENTSKSIEIINKHSAASKKIQLFMSLFRGRNDVYAKRLDNKKGGSGYSPVCANEWKPGVCFKRKVKCFKCQNKSYSQLNEAVIEAHLTGSKIVGIYPMNPDETCYFLAMDFDKDGWQKDITAIKNVCQTFQIPVAVERSGSGNGGHVWFFFEHAISASAARKFGMSLLTKATTEIIFNKQNFFPVYVNDIKTAQNQILIVSPFMTKNRVLQMMDFFKEQIGNHVKVSILTRPAEEFHEDKRAGLNEIFTLLQNAGITVLLKTGYTRNLPSLTAKLSGSAVSTC